MAYLDEPAAAEPMLQSVLRLLSQPAEEQIRRFTPGGCIPCDICTTLSWWREHHADSPFAREFTASQRSALEAVTAMIRTANPLGSCYKVERVRSEKAFEDLRQAAAKALEAFGWSPGVPDALYLPGTEQCAARLISLREERRKLQRGSRLPGPVTLRFHQAVCELMGIEPAFSAKNLEILQQRQQTLAMRFPASVAELLSLQGFCEALFEYAECYPGHSAETDEWRMLEKFGDPDDVRQGHLHVLTDREGIVGFYLRPDEGEDPPVYSDNAEPHDDLSQVPWDLKSGSFSAFIFEIVAWGRFSHYRGGLEFEVRCRAPDAALLAQLRGQFREGPGTQSPAMKTWNFFTPRSVIHMAWGETWWIGAADADALYDVLKALWRFPAFVESLEALDESVGFMPEVKSVLDRLGNDLSP